MARGSGSRGRPALAFAVYDGAAATRTSGVSKAGTSAREQQRSTNSDEAAEALLTLKAQKKDTAQVDTTSQVRAPSTKPLSANSASRNLAKKKKIPHWTKQAGPLLSGFSRQREQSELKKAKTAASGESVTSGETTPDKIESFDASNPPEDLENHQTLDFMGDKPCPTAVVTTARFAQPARRAEQELPGQAQASLPLLRRTKPPPPPYLLNLMQPLQSDARTREDARMPCLQPAAQPEHSPNEFRGLMSSHPAATHYRSDNSLVADPWALKDSDRRATLPDRAQASQVSRAYRENYKHGPPPAAIAPDIQTLSSHSNRRYMAADGGIPSSVQTHDRNSALFAHTDTENAKSAFATTLSHGQAQSRYHPVKQPLPPPEVARFELVGHLHRQRKPTMQERYVTQVKNGGRGPSDLDTFGVTEEELAEDEWSTLGRGKKGKKTRFAIPEATEKAIIPKGGTDVPAAYKSFRTTTNAKSPQAHKGPKTVGGPSDVRSLVQIRDEAAARTSSKKAIETRQYTGQKHRVLFQPDRIEQYEAEVARASEEKKRKASEMLGPLAEVLPDVTPNVQPGQQKIAQSQQGTVPAEKKVKHISSLYRTSKLKASAATASKTTISESFPLQLPDLVPDRSSSIPSSPLNELTTDETQPHEHLTVDGSSAAYNHAAFQENASGQADAAGVYAYQFTEIDEDGPEKHVVDTIPYAPQQMQAKEAVPAPRKGGWFWRK